MNKRRFNVIIAHSSIILSVVFIVLLIIDSINPAMDFIASDQSHCLLWIFCIVSFLNGFGAAVRLYKRPIKKKSTESGTKSFDNTRRN